MITILISRPFLTASSCWIDVTLLYLIGKTLKVFMRPAIILCLLLTTSLQTVADSKIDSLENLLPRSSGREKLNICLALAKECIPSYKCVRR